ncbi:substrate-binding domain-containing protein [Demequina globuliformis]|uniref:substrate-binding domain-containing protein n=1 Tax=Demequina globuliformis TaxID=676202 RepID=UPI00078492E3|nr:substrate-binding domain-containing protein [Demequina globuliformis]
MYSPFTRRGTAAAGLLALTLAVAGCSADSADDEAESAPSADATSAAAQADSGASEGTQPSLEFAGPNGEVPGTLDELTLTDDEAATIADGGHTAAFVWHTSSEFVSAVEQGAVASFEELGIDVVASTEAGFDAATQANNVESVMALDPDIVVGIAVDPTSAAQSFQPIVDAGKTLVIMTTPPAGYEAGDQFVSIVTESLTDAGRANAELLGDALGGTGQVAYLYHDADFWFTNQRDEAFKAWLEYEYPDMDIVAEQGFTDEARTEEIAAATLLQNPDVTGIYVPWATAAQGVLAAVKAAGRTDVAIVTNDLDTTLAADMAAEGNVVGLVGNGSLDIGHGLAVAGAYGLLGKEAPALVASPPVKVTPDNLVDGWMADYGTEPPASVTGN